MRGHVGMCGWMCGGWSLPQARPQFHGRLGQAQGPHLPLLNPVKRIDYIVYRIHSNRR